MVAIATDPKPLRFAGQALICAQLAHDYGFTDLDGNATPQSGSAVCTNGRFHDEVLGHLAGPGA